MLGHRKPRGLTELVISLILLILIIEYIVRTIQPWIPYIIGACFLLLIGWIIYTRLKRL
jgi:hypothetical protein